MELATFLAGSGLVLQRLEIPKRKFVSADFDGILLLSYRATEPSLRPGPVFIIREGQFSLGGESRPIVREVPFYVNIGSYARDAALINMDDNTTAILKPTSCYPPAKTSLSVEASLVRDAIHLSFIAHLDGDTCVQVRVGDILNNLSFLRVTTPCHHSFDAPLRVRAESFGSIIGQKSHWIKDNSGNFWTIPLTPDRLSNEKPSTEGATTLIYYFPIADNPLAQWLSIANASNIENNIQVKGAHESHMDFRKVLSIRQRLSHLTGHDPTHSMASREFQQWKASQVKVRESAQSLATAICQVAENLLPTKTVKGPITVQIEILAAIDVSSFRCRYCGWNLIHESLRSCVTNPPNTTTETQSSSTSATVRLQVVPTWDSLQSICSQDLFLAIFSSLADMLVIRKTAILESGGHVLLQNSAVTTISGILSNSGLVSRSDALSCAMSLLAKRLHPDPESLFSDLIDAANTYRRNGELERAETLMQWACLNFLPSDSGENEAWDESSAIFIKTLLTTGEPYRWSCAERSKKERHEVRISGIKWMIDKFSKFSRQYFEIKRILEDYEGISKLMGNENSRNLNKSSKKHPLVQAIQDRDRKRSLWQLCFTVTGDFSCHDLDPALPLAARNNWFEVVSAIIEMKANVDSRDEDKRTSVSYCVQNGNLSLLQHFIRLSASLQLPIACYDQPLLDLAQEYNQGAAAEAILRAGYIYYGEGSYCSMKGNSSLLWAIENGLLEVIHMLVDQKAQRIPRDRYSDAKLIMSAAGKGNGDILNILLQHNFNIECKYNLEEQSALSLAAVEGNETAVALLLNYRADMESVDGLGRTPLLLAIENGHEAITQLLLAHSNVPTTQPRVWTSLLFAVLKGHWICVQLLLQRWIASTSTSGGPSLCAENPQKATLSPLQEMEDTPDSDNHSTSSEDIGRVVELLISRGVELEQEIEGSMTPLLVATQNGQVDAVKVLLDNGADVEPRDEHSFAAPEMACLQGNEVLIRLFLQRHADLQLDFGVHPPWWHLGSNMETIRCELLETVTDDETKKRMRQRWDEMDAPEPDSSDTDDSEYHGQ
ncbi:Pfs, ankyrin repeats & 6-phosphofructo-2-kinase [Fusarium austroafricanum]|uniref:Pfs, ankyrin repeats & 6-phosphofructo-2-kinase n=1 Tax=Fusarium austroafricanum TaxID=2364996 RepID=A0A8H4NRF1_9HYPO|nr:Pfs, ankyrin repeats & 6-phosphofructo-2-kinase [Fusarium austroafricanum]